MRPCISTRGCDRPSLHWTDIRIGYQDWISGLSFVIINPLGLVLCYSGHCRLNLKQSIYINFWQTDILPAYVSLSMSVSPLVCPYPCPHFEWPTLPFDVLAGVSSVVPVESPSPEIFRLRRLLYHPVWYRTWEKRRNGSLFLSFYCLIFT